MRGIDNIWQDFDNIDDSRYVFDITMSSFVNR